MISQRDIAAWRAHAPWSDDAMVEQDWLISRAVQLVFEEPKLAKQLAMRGGTVLHKAHLAPAARYSEDIDLVLTHATRSHRGIREDVATALEPLLGRPAESAETVVRLAVRNLVSKSKIARLVYVYSPTSNAAIQAQLKVEINLSERTSQWPLERVQMLAPGTGTGDAMPIDVVSYDLNEMLGTKLRALLQREHGRDLFDLWRAWEAAGASGKRALDPVKVAAAFRFYMQREGSSPSREDVHAELERRMRSRKFLADMQNYLPVGQSYDPAVAHAVFVEHFLPHL